MSSRHSSFKGWERKSLPKGLRRSWPEGRQCPGQCVLLQPGECREEELSFQMLLRAPLGEAKGTNRTASLPHWRHIPCRVKLEARRGGLRKNKNKTKTKYN